MAGLLNAIKFRQYRRRTAGAEKNTLIDLALENKLALEVQYHNKEGETRFRTVEPLYIDKSGNLKVWDQEEKGYRSFIPEKILTAQWTGAVFTIVDRKIPVLDDKFRVRA